MAAPDPLEVEQVSLEMLNFVTSSVNEQPLYVKERIRHFLEQGANPLYGSKDSGKTALHLVATYWDKDVADLFAGKILNIDIRDNCGRTPLHEAAAANNSEMVQWLIEHTANLEMKTDKECHTPLHYAARNDAIQSLKVLLHAGAILESRDYRCRTPLHLAVDMGRSLAADYLISLPKPAQVRVAERDGNMAISSMIKTMPLVAYKALNQLRQIDPAEREESLILSYIEPDIDKVFCGVKSPFDTAVSQGKSKILAHSVMQALIKEKWKFLRVYFYIYFCTYILFLLIWSVLMCYPTLHQQHIYLFPRDSWRVVLQVIFLVLLMTVIVQEIIVIVVSTRRHMQHFKICRLKRQEDLSNLILSDKEKEFVQEYNHVSIVPPYLKAPFTIITIVSNMLTLLVVVLYIINITDYSHTFANWTARVACFATILMWFRVFPYLRAIPSLGSLISVIIEIKGDIFRYFLLAVIIYIPYVLSMWLLFGGPQSAFLEDGPTKKDLSTFYHVAVMAFRITLIDSYPYDAIRELDEVMTLLLIAPFLLLLAVIGLNLFIALLSNTFQKVQDEAFANSLLQWATLISYYEEKLFCRSLYTRYSNHIRENCNPLVRKYRGVIEAADITSHPEVNHSSKAADEGDEHCLTFLERRVNAEIAVLRQELISTFKDTFKNTSGENEEVLSPIPGGFIRSRSSTRRKRALTMREKEWQRKIQSSQRRYLNN